MRYSPYLRTRTIDDGAVALARTADAFLVNVWLKDDDTFHDVEVAEHNNSSTARRTALAIAREFYERIVETGIGARELVHVSQEVIS